MNDFQKAFPSPFNEDHFISGQEKNSNVGRLV